MKETGDMMMRQLVIVRKDLKMSQGKLAAQVSHASMAFLTHEIQNNTHKVWKYHRMPSFRINPGTGEKEWQSYRRSDLCTFSKQAFDNGEDYFSYRPMEPQKPYGELEMCENEVTAYSCRMTIDKDIYENWICGIFTKTICGARNRNQLLKAVSLAEELGLCENQDFFLIKDNCLTELKPEEICEDGVGRTLTCIGFKPLPDDVAHQISRKYQLL